jgi:hypothetical protein
MGNDNHVVVSHKLCSFQVHVGGRGHEGAIQCMLVVSVKTYWQTP